MNRPLALLLALALCSCQANLTASIKPKAGSSAAPPAATPTKAATNAKVAAPAPLAPPVKLARPAGTTSVLAGRVAMDPGYAVSLKAGSVISNDGASVLAANAHLIGNDGASIISNDGGGIISNDGGSLISNDGGGIVAQGGGNVVAPAGLISQDGGGLITNDGGSLITNDGGSLITNDGGSLITNDGGSRRLLETAATGHAPRPAAGMAVFVRSLTTHQPVALGTGKDGKPVYVVYTNLQGGYELYLPEALKDNVEVVAFVPGKPDARLNLQQITPPGVADGAVDEDTSQIVKYIRMGFRKFAETLMTGNKDQVVKDMKLDQSPTGALLFMPVLESLTAAIKAAKIDQIPPQVDGKDNPKYQRVVDRIIDIVIAKTEFNAATPEMGMILPDNTYKPRHQDCLHIMADFFADRREKAAALLDDPAAVARVESLPFVLEANKRRAEPFRFLRPSDYSDLLALAAINEHTVDATELPHKIGDYDKLVGVASDPGEVAWFAAAYDGVIMQLGFALFLNGQVQEDLRALFTANAP